jgi:hypothetical protein
MKKSIVYLAAALSLLALVNRPIAAGVNIDLGIKGGWSLTNIKLSSDAWAHEGLNEPIVGAFLAFNLSKSFAIQPEVLYLSVGAFQEAEVEGDLLRLAYSYYYIHVPVLAKLHLVNSGKIRPVIFAGPAVGFLTAFKERSYVNGDLSMENDISELIKSTNFSVVFGGGMEFRLAKLLLLLDVRYDLGLSDVNKSGDGFTKTRALIFMAGLGF